MISNSQLYIFIIFILTGLLIGILFDIFRILRKTFKTTDLLTNIEDIVFWLLTGLLLLYTIFKFNNGQIRFFIFIAILIGVIIYILLFSKTFIKVNVNIINYLKKIIKKTYKIVIFPIKIISKLIRKIIFKPISIICINIRNFSTNYFKKQKAKIKKSKKVLNKAKNKALKEGF